MKSKAFFLDRDGVINYDSGHVGNIENFRFIDGVFDACKIIKKHGYRIILVTNQAGIAKGYYSESDFMKLTDWMNHQFSLHGINIDKVYYCPHHPDSRFDNYRINCQCRKPNPGMINMGIKEFNIDINSSVLVGDKMSDIESADNAGLKQTFLLESDYRADSSLKTYNSLSDVVNEYFKNY